MSCHLWCWDPGMPSSVCCLHGDSDSVLWPCFSGRELRFWNTKEFKRSLDEQSQVKGLRDLLFSTRSCTHLNAFIILRCGQFLFYVYGSFAYVCVCAPLVYLVPTWSFGSGVTDVCDPSYRCWELNLGLHQPVFLTSEPSPHPSPLL